MAINMTAIGRTRGLFTRAEAIEAGLTDKDLRKGPFRRVLHGVYRTADTPLTHELRCKAAAMMLPPEAVITGRSAATLHGVALARPHDPVEVLVKGCKRLHGVRTWDVRRYPFECFPWAGVRLATLERTAFDLLARNSLHQGIALCDALLHSGLITEGAVGRFLGGRRDDGIVLARKGFELLDGRAESIPESVLRVMFVLAGLDPVPQLPILGPGGTELRADLGFEEARVVVEYEGAWHADPVQFQRDQRRRRWLRDSGWHVIVVTADDLANAADRIIQQVAAVVRAREPSVLPRTGT